MALVSHALQIAFAYAGCVALATLAQLGLVLGPPLLLAALLQPVALHSERWTARLIGPRALWVLVGWVATSLHELGHALFALLFGHDVTRVKWFDFHATGGTLGQVEHRYDPSSPYQRAGRFFIGLGPVIVGALVLALAGWLLLGATGSAGDPIAHVRAPDGLADLAGYYAALLGAALHRFSRLLAMLRLGQWNTWAFLYLAYVGASTMRLSGSDLRSVGAGLWTLSCLLLLVNALTLWAGAPATSLALQMARALALCNAMLLAAIALHALVGAAAVGVTHGVAYVRGRRLALGAG